MINFINVVKSSRVLTSEQKELLLADPQLPETFQRNVAATLAEFDEHSKAREALLREKLEQSYTEFIRQLDSAGIGEEKKKELLKKARKQIEEFFPK